ncbi:putative dihydrodipicolinate synthase protein [Botryosphaeria dothidea]|uniref:Dihydrodipicolinate synthase protein n=1 Tax=Botryosphaeria dothidea TaxID=55169 RepID=A0A8H4J2P0_9PEZI|nr:putative dihydrodipicolinate synthase protein [Botryosphaeria dothidea]
MASQKLEGILVALITPFTEGGKEIDAGQLDVHINNLIAAGVHGLVPGGSTGEFTTLSNAERKTLLELCIKSVAGRVPVVAGIGALSTPHSISCSRADEKLHPTIGADALDLATHAAHAGASALMVVPPFYDPLTAPQLHEYFADIHAAAPHLALVYYNSPGASGVALSPAELAGLRAAGVTHLKDTSGNGPALTELLFGLQDEITAFNGWDTLAFYALCAGAKGGVWGAASVVPELSMRLWDVVAVRGDLGEGRRVWAKIWPDGEREEAV